MGGELTAMKPAVAVMAKVPGIGTVKSRLHGCLTPERAHELYRCFLLDRLEALARVSEVEPVIAFTPPEGEAVLARLAPPVFRLIPQSGDDLGARLSNLLAALIGHGYPAAIALDSDSPTLPMEYVARAVETLTRTTADVVLGPCEDGGYYLIGLRRAEPRLFEAIPWSTERVLAATIARARMLGLETRLLPSWFDVDTEADLRRLRADLSRATDPPPRTSTYLADLFSAVS